MEVSSDRADCWGVRVFSGLDFQGEELQILKTVYFRSNLDKPL